jgi:hypothetical protein
MHLVSYQAPFPNSTLTVGFVKSLMTATCRKLTVTEFRYVSEAALGEDPLHAHTNFLLRSEEPITGFVKSRAFQNAA